MYWEWMTLDKVGWGRLRRGKFGAVDFGMRVEMVERKAVGGV
jgi:hypothetical protein